MNKGRFNRLQRAAAFVVTLASVACGIFWNYVEQSNERLRADAVARVEQQSVQLAAAVSRQMSILGHLIDAAVIRLRDTWVAAGEQAFRDTATKMLSDFPPGAVLQIGFMDRQGYLSYSTMGLRERVYVGDREHFRTHAESEEDRLFISHPVVGRASNAWSILFTRPIRKNGQFIGVAVVSILPKYIADSLLLPEAGADDIAAVLYPDGTFASRNKQIEEAMGKSVPPDRPFVGTNVARSGTLSGASVVDGVRRIYSWRRVDEFPLVVTVGLAVAPILEPVEQTIQEARLRALVSIVCLLLLSGGIAVLLLRVGRDERSLLESERFLDSIVENIPAMLFVKHASDLRFVKLNKAGEDLLGHSRQEFIGKDDYDLFPKEQADYFTARDREVLANLSVVDIPEEPIETSAGRKIFHTRKISIADNAGKPKFLLGISVDITDQKWQEGLDTMRRLILEEIASENALEASLAYVVRLIEKHGDGGLCSVLLLDGEGQQLRHGAAPSLPDFYNQAVDGVAVGAQNGCWGAAAFLGTRVIVEDMSCDASCGAIADLARQLGLCSCWCEPIHSAGGKILGVFTIYQRMSRVPDAKDLRLIDFAAQTTALMIERKTSEAELTSYRINLEQLVAERTRDLVVARNLADKANQAKSAFLANMSHELRTPLNAILGFSALMRKDAVLGERHQEHLDIINRSGEYLLALINDILDMAKIEAGRSEVTLMPFDVHALMRDIVDLMQARAAEKCLSMAIERSPDLPRFIKGDETRLRQVLINLLGNAIKFTDEGGITLRLSTAPDSASLRLAIEVEDTGPGIAQADQQRIFEPFVQAGRPSAQKGTGLGLAISRQFVELMGGLISLRSEPGHGSCFRVELPVELAAESAVASRSAAGRAVIGLEPGQPSYRLLIVEDQPENALLLRSWLEGVGFTTRVAENGIRGVALFEAWQPHFIWMDQRMPEMDGTEATRRIRALPGGKDVRIVALTASVFAEQHVAMRAAGVDEVVHKPVDSTTLFDCLMRHLGVRYVYAERAAQTDPAPAIEANLAAALAALPEDLRHQLADAVVILDSQRIATLIERVADRDAAAAKIVRQHAEDFNYAPIEEALRKHIQGANDGEHGAKGTPALP